MNNFNGTMCWCMWETTGSAMSEGVWLSLNLIKRILKKHCEKSSAFLFCSLKIWSRSLWDVVAEKLGNGLQNRKYAKASWDCLCKPLCLRILKTNKFFYFTFILKCWCMFSGKTNNNNFIFIFYIMNHWTTCITI